MFKTLLAAVDGSAHAKKALEKAAQLAQSSGGKLIVLGVYRHHSPLETTHSLVKGREEIEPPDVTLGRLAREIVDEAVARARELGAKDVEGMVRRGPIARTIVAVAEERAADAIVLGGRGTGDVEGFLLGSVSYMVCSIAPCTCIAVR